MHVVGLGPDLQAGQVGHAGDGVLGIGEVTEAHVAPAQVDEPLLIVQHLGQLVAELAQQGLVGVIHGGEQVGQAHHVELGDKAADDGVVQIGHLQVAHLDGVEVLRQGAQHGVGVDLHGDVAVGGRLQGRLEGLLQHDVGGVLLGGIVGDADGDLVGGGDLSGQGDLAGVDRTGGVGGGVATAGVAARGIAVATAGGQGQCHCHRKGQG